MSFWRKKKPQHPPASSLLDDPVSDQEIQRLPPPALPTSTDDNLGWQQQAITTTLDQSPGSQSPELSSSLPRSPSPPTQQQQQQRSPSTSTRRFSRFSLFRRSSSMSKRAEMDTPTLAAGISPNTAPLQSIPIKSIDTPDSRTLSPQPRQRTRTPTQSPYASPRTSIYGALSSPSSSSNPGAEIFERSIESVLSVSTTSPSVKAVPTHQMLEDIIPPALEATAATLSDHVDPDQVEIVTFSEIQSTSDSRSNAGSPVPPSPVLSGPPPEATLNPWDTTSSSPEPPTSTGSPDLDGKKRTLSLMSAVDHLADEIIHPALPAAVEKKTHAPSPLSLSPAITPSDVPAVRNAMTDLSMERSPSQTSSIGDVMVIKQNMGDALRHQRHLHSAGEISAASAASAASPSIESQQARKEELDVNPWSV